MNLVINRDLHIPDESEIGTLSIDGTYFGNTLEDASRETKIQNETCIPYSKDLPPVTRYKVKVTFSEHFQKRLPLIYTNEKTLEIESEHGNWAGARFHGGNTELDTEGCVLVARNRFLNTSSNWFTRTHHMIRNFIQGSLADKLTAKLDNGEVHYLTIK